ncbi:3'-phosphoadenosine 5'-phosphosulfate sulfotransferase (PAPS reductase)/FAD synthetase [Methylobacterium sp. PvP062]|nr:MULTISPECIES: phosphoadenosine phosphosulfate reductase family protein [unclassified Methylobacterium]MBP2495422.1 3'-phosphoadenosine 5'-phosphosulfate sulfotransferase (PAPS reductase)/FAD synthetase [Methylobacterium sp. PvP105]MCX7335720.1 phosphoadenosine phosphosulfate reductase family protein [Hyphomicrobiales bacterium]
MSENPYLIQGPALISFSGGRTSGYMLKHILDAHGGTLPADVHVAFANTGREMPETLDFVQECSERWGVPIVWLEFDPEAPHKTAIVNHNSAGRDGEPLAAVLAQRQMLANPVMRFCTIDSKIKRLQAYARHILGFATWANVVGLRADEPDRVAKQHARAASGKDGKNFGRPMMPLADAGVARRDVAAWWARQSFDLRLENVGGKTPHGNCDLCFLKGAATIVGILRDRPDLADWWIAQERRFASTKRPGDFAYFRKDRPSYAELLRLSQDQGDLLTFEPQEESLDCACTD